MSRSLPAVLLVSLLFVLRAASAVAAPLDSLPSASPPDPIPLQSPFIPLTQPGEPDSWQGRVNAPLALAYELWQERSVTSAGAASADQAARLEALERMVGGLQGQVNAVFDGPVAGSAVLVKTTDNAVELEALGISVHARIGDIASAFIPFDWLRDVASLPSVLRIEAASRYEPMNDAGTVDTQAPAVWSQFDETGQGVVIGVVDSGIDPFHPDFIGPDGASRVKYLLDLSDPGDPDSDGQLNGSTYGGTAYTPLQIGAAASSPGYFRRSTDAPVAIPDNAAGGVTRTINVSENVPITSAAVDVYVDHPFISNLRITLICPNGAQQVLFDRSGGDRDDVVGVFPVTACNGQSAAGAWRINVADLATSNTGSLLFWNLHVNRAVRMTDQVGHGTHVLGSAGGNGRATGAGLAPGTFKGMAPSADLIVVRGTRGFITGFSDPDIVNALSFIDQKAAEMGRPWVANLSLGGHVGAHDGTGLLEQAIDNLVGPGKPGKAVVVAAGNEGDEAIHAAGQVPAGGVKEVAFNIPSAPSGFYAVALLNLWYEGSDSFGVGFRDPSGNGLTRTISPGQSGACYANANYSEIVCVDSMSNSTANGDKEIFLLVQATASQAGQWKLLLHGDQALNGRFDAWVIKGSEWHSDVSNDMRVGMPGTARNAITVGAHVTKNQWLDVSGTSRSVSAMKGGLAAFSSDGPTRDRRRKPDLTAPGQEICSTLSSGSLVGSLGSMYSLSNYVCRDGVHGISQGTSMAAPHVTGAVALLLGLRPGLDSAKIKTALTSRARADSYTGGVPNDEWGYGKLNVLGAAQAVAPVLDERLYLPLVVRMSQSLLQTPTATSTRTTVPVFTVTTTPTRTSTPAAEPGIYGRVTNKGAAAAGISLDLRHWDGSGYYTQATTTTGTDGRYRFVNVPALPSGHSYYVRYLNTSGNSNYVAGWYNPDIDTYSTGATVAGGEFDMANVALSSPASGYSSAVPITFKWLQRGISGDTYRWAMFDLSAEDVWLTNDLGSADTFTLTALPGGASYGQQYGWYVMVYKSADSYGDSYYYRTFSATAGSPPQSNSAPLPRDKARGGEGRLRPQP